VRTWIAEVVGRNFFADFNAGKHLAYLQRAVLLGTTLEAIINPLRRNLQLALFYPPRPHGCDRFLSFDSTNDSSRLKHAEKTSTTRRNHCIGPPK
jgi:hypothetical protein